MQTPKSKTAGLFVICLVYVLAATAGVFVYYVCGMLPPLIRLFTADVLSTIVVFAFSLLLGNASVYDPYWSVAPVFILILLAVQENRPGLGPVLLVAVVFFWGIRLTVNWAYTFRSLAVQDWRYDSLRQSNPKLYPLVSLIGIHMMPTCIVFMALIPGIYYLQAGGVNWLTAAGLAVCVAGAILELVSDLQMHRFRSRGDKSKIIRTGLWKYSRHPNYLGEICFWWGVYAVMLSVLPQMWVLFLGAICNTLLFVLISIPMAEKHLAAYKAGYAGYKAVTRMLLPIPRPVKKSGS